MSKVPVLMAITFKQLIQQVSSFASEKKIAEASLLYTSWLERVLKSPANLEPEVKSQVAIAYNNLGQLKYLQVDFEGAVQDYEKAIQNDPQLASAYYNRGTIHYRLGRFDEALDDMLMATHYSPDNEEFKVGLEKTKNILSNSKGIKSDSEVS